MHVALEVLIGLCAVGCVVLLVWIAWLIPVDKRQRQEAEERWKPVDRGSRSGPNRSMR